MEDLVSKAEAGEHAEVRRLTQNPNWKDSFMLTLQGDLAAIEPMELVDAFVEVERKKEVKKEEPGDAKDRTNPLEANDLNEGNGGLALQENPATEHWRLREQNRARQREFRAQLNGGGVDHGIEHDRSGERNPVNRPPKDPATEAHHRPDGDAVRLQLKKRAQHSGSIRRGSERVNGDEYSARAELQRLGELNRLRNAKYRARKRGEPRATGLLTPPAKTPGPEPRKTVAEPRAKIRKSVSSEKKKKKSAKVKASSTESFESHKKRSGCAVLRSSTKK